MSLLKPIPLNTKGYYLASEDGKIYKRNGVGIKEVNAWLHRGYIPGQGYSDKYYRRVAIIIDGKRKLYYVHRLILLAFEGPGRDFDIVRHLNDNSEDNRITNLAYGSHLQNNVDDRKANGTYHKRGPQKK